MKIKFRALCLAMTLVVMAASVASATATFVGIDKDGNVEKVTVDPTAESGSRVTYESVSLPTSAKSGFVPVQYRAPSTNGDGLVGYKLFSYNGAVLAVSDDATGTVAGGDRVITFKVADDGTITYNTITKEGTTNGLSAVGAGQRANTAFSGVKNVLEFNGYPVFVAEQGISTLIADNWKFDDPDAFVSFDISVDVAFAFNNKLYVISSADAAAAEKKYTVQKIYQLSNIERETTDKAFANGALFDGAGMTWADPAYSGAFDAVIANNYVYIATETGLYKFPMEEKTDTGIILDSSAPKVTQVNTNPYLAMTAVDDTLYALQAAGTATAGYTAVSLVSIKDDTVKTLYQKVSEDVVLALSGKASLESFDIYATSDVIAVTNLGTKTAFYAIDGEKWKLINENVDVYPTLALVKTASSGGDDSKGETTTTTVVNASTLATASQDNLVAATPASAISDFVTAEEASTSTVPSGAQAKIEALLKTDDKTTVTLAAKTNYTPAKDGYLLVKEAVDVSKVRVYFVEAATTTAATGDLTAATFLDADCKEMGSTGTSVYAASDKLESGKTYTLVEATVSTSSSGDDGDSSGSTTSSSSGGCDAGFGLWAAAALMAVSTISKRR